MIFTTSALVALGLILSLLNTTVLAELPDEKYGSKSCSYLLERKEWRALSEDEKKCYIDAVKCLQTRRAQNASTPDSWTRFDEFHSTHIGLSLKVHYVGQFLPWHRLFLKTYETALRKECGYTGAQPYWDWSIDADPPNLFSKSPIWDSVTGFGGDGVPGTYTVPPDPANTSKILPESYYHGCVRDGPFTDYTIKLGPGLLVTNHCLTRGVNDTYAGSYLTSSVIAHTLSLPNFEQFRVDLEGLPVPPNIGPHGGGHAAIGGDMSNYFSSPADPLFYMHHTNLDRIWWRWQQASPEHLYDFSGSESITPPYGNVTLSYPLNMGSTGPTLPVRDVMDTRKEPSCYVYI